MRWKMDKQDEDQVEQIPDWELARKLLDIIAGATQL